MHKITIQRMVPNDIVPAHNLIQKWAKSALKQRFKAAEINIRIVDISEMTDLNQRYRHKKGPTNVLSFPFDMPEEIEDEITTLGDIVICADIVNQEALSQDKMKEAHWAHMVIHGTLHLLGFDHENEVDAAVMEPQEIALLASLGYKNPYLTIENKKAHSK